MALFEEPLNFRLRESQLDESEILVRCMMHVNSQLDGGYIFSCGKNMGVFKAVGYPEDVGEYYRLEVCLNCHRCISLCPARALKIVRTDHCFRKMPTGRKKYI